MGPQTFMSNIKAPMYCAKRVCIPRKFTASKSVDTKKKLPAPPYFQKKCVELKISEIILRTKNKSVDAIKNTPPHCRRDVPRFSKKKCRRDGRVVFFFFTTSTHFFSRNASIDTLLSKFYGGEADVPFFYNSCMYASTPRCNEFLDYLQCSKQKSIGSRKGYFPKREG